MCSEAHLFKGLFCLLLLFLIRASFSKDDEKPVSKKINISYIKLVSMCSLGTVLWLLHNKSDSFHSGRVLKL